MNIPAWRIVAFTTFAACGLLATSTSCPSRSAPPPAASGPATASVGGTRHDRFSAMRQSSQASVPLNQHVAFVETHDGARRWTKVVLEQLNMVRTLPPSPVPDEVPRERTIFCYRLRPTSPEVEWEWCKWELTRPLFRVRVFADEVGTYFAWVYGGWLLFDDATRPRDEQQALEDDDAGVAACRVRVTKALGDRYFPSLDGHRDITPLSITKRPDGRFTVILVGKDPSRKFTFVGTGDDFRLK